MFAAEMEILTLTPTTSNATIVNNAADKISCNNEFNSKSQNLHQKLKYLHAANKYCNQSGNNNSNSKHSKKHNNNNSNTNINYSGNCTTNLVNRKRYYNQQQQQQKAVNNSNTNNRSNNNVHNNNNKLVKNRNIEQSSPTKTQIIESLILTSKTVDNNKQNNIGDRNRDNLLTPSSKSNSNSNNKSNNTSYTETIASTISSNNENSSFFSEIANYQNTKPQQQSWKKKLIATNTKLTSSSLSISSSSSTLTNGSNIKNKLVSSSCNGSWTKSKESVEYNNSDYKGITIVASKNKNVVNKDNSSSSSSSGNGSCSKKKSYFKNSRNTSNIYLQPKEHRQQQQEEQQAYTADDISIFAIDESRCPNVTDNNVASSCAAGTLTFQKLSYNKIAANRSSIAVEAAMTTALATAAVTNSTATPNTSASNPSETLQKPNNNVVHTTTTQSVDTTLQPLSKEAVAEESTSITSTAITSSSSTSSTVTVSAASTSTPNSYSLDFLHSVGVQMTGGVSIASIKTSNNMANNMRPYAYSSNNNTNNIIGSLSPARANFNFTNVTNHRQNRYLSGGGGGQLQHQHHHPHHGHHPNFQQQQHHQQQQQQHHHHHHHPQPQQLTIASFMQKELTESFAIATRGIGNHNSNILSNNNNNGGMNSSTNNNNNSNNGKTFENHVGHYGDQQQQRYHNFYHQQQHRHSHQQNQHHHRDPNNYLSLQHAYNAIGEGRNITNGGSGRQSFGNSYHSGNSGGGGSHLVTYRHNFGNIANGNMQKLHHPLQASQQLQQLNKKNPFSSSSNSSCSSSSSSSTSSISSQTSAASSIQRQQHGNNPTSNTVNFAIETLSSKSHYGSSHRGHRSHHHHHHHQHHNNPHQQQRQNQHQHQHHHHHQQHIISNSTSNTSQHQNFHNLTYVATNSLAVPQSSPLITTTIPASNSRGCSPFLATPPSTLPALGGAAIEESALQLTANQGHQHQISTNNYFQQKQQEQAVFFAEQQPHQQPPPSFSKILNISSADSATSLTESACSSHLDETTRTTIGSNDSLHSSVAALSTSNSLNVGSDYDSDSASSKHSINVANTLSGTHQQQELQSQQLNELQQQKYKQLKPSLSSSSSASSTTSASSAQENVSPPQTFQNIVDIGYAFSFDPHQQFPQQQFPNHHQPNTPQLLSPQQQHHYRSGVVSLINLSTSNYVDEDGNTLAQIHQHLSHQQQQQSQQLQQQHQQLYFASGEHLSISAVNSAFWTPSPSSLQSSNFVYSTATNVYHTGPSSCASSTASLSPRLNEREEQGPLDQHMQGNQFKRSQFLPTSLQRNSQINSHSAGQRLRGRSQHQHHHHFQHQQQQHQATSHPFQQHDLFFGGGPQHLRSSSSTSSGHDFFSHTPPDRFLARAHLIEAKQMPLNLLNNSKWDVLSQGIWDKFVISQQTEDTFKQKMRLWRYLYIFIKNAYPRYGLYLVGSTISGFGSDTSDVDMCLVSRSPSGMEPRQEALINLLGLRDCLAKSGEFENFNLIEAKVPILRFRDRIHQLEVDLNYNNCVGIKNTHLLYCYSQLDWRLRPLVLVTKLWAQFHNINNAKNMTISSYSLVLMVIHFLQYAVNPSVLPCLHEMYPDKFQLLRSNDFGYVDMNETIGPYESKNNQSIGELFLNFLEYYSCFDYSQFAISIRTGGLMPINVCRQAKSLKNDIHQWKELCIEEPFDLTNTARSVYDFETFERVKAVFVASWRILQETLDVNAVFSPITISPQPITKLVEHSTVSLPMITYSKVLIGKDTAAELIDDDSVVIAEVTIKSEENVKKEINCINNNSNSNNSNNNNYNTNKNGKNYNNSNNMNNNNTINTSNSNTDANNNNNNHKSLTALIS